MDIYREQIIDLHEHPLNFGELETADFCHEDDNPLCGDIIRIAINLDDSGRVYQVGWTGSGCAISQAAASLLTETIKGMSLTDIQTFPPERLLDLIGVPLSQARRKCALLPLKVLQAGVSGAVSTDE
ncbi:MAG: iron-sulfur cluster assembly scaffold protein [Chloroflexi bacterium]|nr:iron-sulfur cluster assembly scaffold protein [Chloroflexota bacterium]MBK6708907.1 iron-sulfur cluster assembly scaffold protein [Chloroflexota bacterium]MBK7914686.1 iron-sulfur cluster assembly scaffold protein [Chloroflexota bacterium]MBK8934483.1 iron-sulfur cluster assembly scaffold protein [Chloroflexota bacterium]MBP6803891.1 iron-sulfur cluster assembly scaffold protein [Chloroflexota bacterium]